MRETVTERRLVASRVFRTGKQSLYRSGGHGLPDQWFVRLENRTNDTWAQIPKEKVPVWRRILGGDA